MNKTRKKTRGQFKGRKAIFGIVAALMVMGVFFLAACDNNVADTDVVEAKAMEGFSRAALTGDSRQVERRNSSRRNGERSFSREDFIRWAEEQGYSREDLSQRHIWREHRHAEGATLKTGERHHHRFDRNNNGENRPERQFQRQPRTRRESPTDL